MPNTPTPIAPSASAGSAGAGDNSCSTGAIQCCEQVQSANSAGIAALLGVLGVVLQDVNVPIGVTCSPISVVGVGGSDACSANTVWRLLGGLISIGCLPVEL